MVQYLGNTTGEFHACLHEIKVSLKALMWIHGLSQGGFYHLAVESIQDAGTRKRASITDA